MSTDNQLKLGYISFINSVPFFACLRESGFNGMLAGGVPSRLNQMLQDGEIDVSPSSSFEYARNWRDYLILPDHSISSQGRVKSVLLFSPVDLDQLEGRTVWLTGESATSVNLLRVLLREFCGLKQVEDRVPDKKIEDLVAAKEPALLIGDRALKMARNLPEEIKVFDLGELWTQYTGLPFVFALWMIRKDALSQHVDQLSCLGDQLMKSRQRVLGRPEFYAEEIAAKSQIDVRTIIDYWRTIDYRLDAEHKEGVTLFFKLCVKHGLLLQEPELNFFEAYADVDCSIG